MSQTSGNHKSTDLLSCLKDEVDARALDEEWTKRARELWTIHAGSRANKQSGNGAGSLGRRGPWRD